MTQIRKYESTDRPAVLELLRLNIPRYFSAREIHDLEYYLDHHAAHFFLLEIDGVIRGCGGYNIAEDGQSAALSWDFFHPESQGQGLGTQLTAFRLRQMLALPGIRRIRVRTSQLAYAFYQKFGLRLQEVVRDYWDPGFDLYRMEAEASEIRLHE